MESLTKIQLSPQQMELVNNTDWILNKHIITKKVYDMFGEINEIFKEEIKDINALFPENLKYQSGKISKGENYQLLPYVILDYPAFFWKDRVLAIRTMFWWGNFFSVTLHLSGIHKEQLSINTEQAFSYLHQNDFYICINEKEWEHHFETDNYIKASDISFKTYREICQKHFFKISKKLHLTEWDNATEFILETFRKIIGLMHINYPSDRKDL